MNGREGIMKSTASEVEVAFTPGEVRGVVYRYIEMQTRIDIHVHGPADTSIVKEAGTWSYSGLAARLPAAGVVRGGMKNGCLGPDSS